MVNKRLKPRRLLASNREQRFNENHTGYKSRFDFDCWEETPNYPLQPQFPQFPQRISQQELEEKMKKIEVLKNLQSESFLVIK